MRGRVDRVGGAGVDLDEVVGQLVADRPVDGGQDDVVRFDLGEVVVQAVEDRVVGRQDGVIAGREHRFDVHIARPGTGLFVDVDDAVGTRGQRSLADRIDLQRVADGADRAVCRLEYHVVAADVDRAAAGRIENALFALDAYLVADDRVAGRDLVDADVEIGVEEHVLASGDVDLTACVDLESTDLFDLDEGDRWRHAAGDADRV